MAVRTPIYYDGTTIAEMTSTQIAEWKTYIAYLYSTDPTVTVTVVSGSGTLDETNEIYDNDFQFDVTR